MGNKKVNKNAQHLRNQTALAPASDESFCLVTSFAANYAHDMGTVPPEPLPSEVHAPKQGRTPRPSEFIGGSGPPRSTSPDGLQVRLDGKLGVRFGFLVLGPIKVNCSELFRITYRGFISVSF
jgi:hypothetical protein